MAAKMFHVKWKEIQNQIKEIRYTIPFSGLRIASINFHSPFISCNDCDKIVFSIMILLLRYALPTESDYGKFTITYVMKIPTGDVPYTIGKAIPFRDQEEINHSSLDKASTRFSCSISSIYALIDQLVRFKAEDYDCAKISSISLRIYLSSPKSSAMPLIKDAYIKKTIWECIKSYKDAVKCSPNDTLSRTINNTTKKRFYDKNNYLTAIIPSNDKMHSFIVADLETVILNDVHVPYAVGFLIVRPEDDLSSSSIYDEIESYFSEDFPSIVFQTFEERSNKIMFDFLERLVVVIRMEMKKKDSHLQIVYFHNFSRFDGIILLKYLATHGSKYTFKPLMRNNKLYELSIYQKKSPIKKKKNDLSTDDTRQPKLLFKLRDSLTLLTGSLDQLSKNLCHHLGHKGSIQHENVKVENLNNNRSSLLDYMKQDILLLGGVMQRAQSIYYSSFSVDIVTKLTMSSLALSIFRTNFYDPSTFPIHIPNQNEDTFIRRGYYGGHADTYIPKGDNLNYYDVNSLYPFIMKTFSMPGGKPVWHGNLEKKNQYDILENMYGFFEAHIVCPISIKRPFLPSQFINKLISYSSYQYVSKGIL